MMMLFLLPLIACNRGPRAIDYGKENCSFCKMTIMDERFAAQCMSTKGKTFVFDDIHCLTHFLRNGGIWRNEVAGIFVSDYVNPNTWIKSDQALFLRSEELRSPMGGNIAAFSSDEDRQTIKQKFNGELLRWKDIYSN